MHPFKRIKRSLVYYFAAGAIFVLNILPRRLALYLGGWIGFTAWWLSAGERYKADRHLKLVFGERFSIRERTAIYRRFAVNTGYNLTDLVRFKQHFENEIRPLVDFEGLELFDEAYRRGKGLLGITGHIGNFELLAAAVASEGYRIAVIGREIYEPRLNQLLVANREAVGLTNIYTTDSPKRIIEWLRSGGALGVLIDTDSHRVRGEFLPAFGRWSYTPVGQSRLGLRTGSAFLPIACLRKPDGRYLVTIRPEVTVEPSGDPDKDVATLTLKCTQVLESIIAEHLDQWPWHHNRWRTRRK